MEGAPQVTRILITGSRDWTDIGQIIYAILDAVDNRGPNVLVHGGSPTGADKLADDVAKAVGLATEVHPADWEHEGRAAGWNRNRRMVALGADICLAFIGRCTSPRCKTSVSHPSHGASHTTKLAEAAGILTRRYYA